MNQRTVQYHTHGGKLGMDEWLSFMLFSMTLYYTQDETVIIQVRRPTEIAAAQFFVDHSTSLRCPCKEAAFESESSVNLSVRLHPICSSLFIENIWIENIFSDGNWPNVPPNQFRTRCIIYFVVQQSICNAAQFAVDRFIIEFLQQIILIEDLLFEDQFMAKIRLSTDSVKNWNQDIFVSLLNFGREGIQTNQLINIFFSNWIYLPQNYKTTPVFHGHDRSYATSSVCIKPVYIDNTIIPGFVLGFCLYNETCVQSINFANLSSINPLNCSLLSQYSPHDTVEQLTLKAFIEEWYINISYSTFFSVCAPSICSYSISKRKYVLQVIAIVLSLYEGLIFIVFLQDIISVFRKPNNRVVAVAE
ncbi:hypothetical protein I4U23_021862 [Adineta vaga]|nr:hypothetical protein I4U23_021862 [Adineta vaga]